MELTLLSKTLFHQVAQALRSLFCAVSAVAGGTFAGFSYRAAGVGTFEEGFTPGAIVGGMEYLAGLGDSANWLSTRIDFEVHLAEKDSFKYFFDFNNPQWGIAGYGGPSLGGAFITIPGLIEIFKRTIPKVD